MITISAFHDREDALISKALLEAAGVAVTLKEEEGQLFLQVPEADAERAHELLSGPDEPGVGGGFRLWRLDNSPAYGPVGAFLWGGFLFTAGVLTLLLLAMPLGVEMRVTLFGLLGLFFVGGCGSVLMKSVRIRGKRV